MVFFHHTECRFLSHLGTTNEESGDQLCPEGKLPSIPNSPLDLSKNSTTHAFYHPPTPDKRSSPSPMDVSGRNPFLFRRQMSHEFTLQAPRIVIQPKTEWHYRNLKDLAMNHIPLLSGNGPQRTPIRVTVSSSFFALLIQKENHFRSYLDPSRI